MPNSLPDSPDVPQIVRGWTNELNVAALTSTDIGMCVYATREDVMHMTADHDKAFPVAVIRLSPTGEIPEALVEQVHRAQYESARRLNASMLPWEQFVATSPTSTRRTRAIIRSVLTALLSPTNQQVKP